MRFFRALPGPCAGAVTAPIVWGDEEGGVALGEGETSPDEGSGLPERETRGVAMSGTSRVVRRQRVVTLFGGKAPLLFGIEVGVAHRLFFLISQRDAPSEK